jgi:hypothetical protein
MKAVFGILSLLVVLAVLGFVARRQLHASNIVPMPASLIAPAASDPNATVADQARALQDQARDQASKAMQQSADRAASADQ